MTNELAFSVQSDWREIDQINTRTRAFLDNTSLSTGEVETYTMVISELMENAIKYGRAHADIDLAVGITATHIHIRVDNQVDQDHIPNLKQFDYTLQWIRGIHDPYQAFLERIREISREPLSDGKSCLGLVRIAYEGHADIDFILDENKLSVSAIASLNHSMSTTESSEDF